VTIGGRAYFRTMLARLILSLLLAAFALPAMAAAPCHDTPAPMVMAPHHSMPATPGHDDGAIMAHACIGCIPPSSMEPRAISHPTIPDDIVRVEIASRFDAGRPAAPTTPPPRTQA
jgi:hypothetical protein